MQAGLFEPIDASKLANASKVPPGLITSHAMTCSAQVVGIAYNPKKFATPPKGWADLFKSPYVERLGLTGFQTTLGTVSTPRERLGPRNGGPSSRLSCR